MDYAKPTLAEALAAEYVAGTLRGRARRRFEALLASHAALRAAVRRWEDRLLPLTIVVPPVAPPPRVWAAVQQRLWPEQAPKRWWTRLALWRAASGLATVAAVSLAVLLAQPSVVPPPVVVVLQSTGNEAAGFVASVGGDGQSLVMRSLLPVAVQRDRVLELWSVPPQGAPKSLGLIAPDGATLLDRKRLPATLLKGGTAALAVSVEPPGGSPTGAPTGPVIYAGKLQL